MTDASERPKRGRGRPRLAPDEKKRRNMTFRVRDELRSAVEELAQANGRSLSEQVEYYVESCVRSEVGLTYQYSTDALSPTLFRALTVPGAPQGPILPVSFPKGHGEMLTIAGKNYINTPKNSSAGRSVDKTGAEHGAIDKARALLDGTVRGVLESFEELFGTHVVEALQANGAVGQSSINIKTNHAFRQMEDKCAEAKAEVERLQAEVEALKARVSSAVSQPVQERNNPLSLEAIEAEFTRLLGRPVPHSRSANSIGAASISERNNLLERLRFLVDPHNDEKVDQAARRHPRMPLLADLPPAEPNSGSDRSPDQSPPKEQSHGSRARQRRR